MTTRRELVSDLKAWSARTDLDDAVVATVLRLAQASIDRDLRLPAQQFSTTLAVVGAAGAALPDDFLTVRSVALIEGNETIRQETVNTFNTNLHLSNRTDPAWAERAGRILVRPTPSTESPVNLSVEYYARFPALVEDEDTNWLLNNAYDVYFNAGMAAVGTFLEDEEMETMYLRKYETAYGMAQRTATRNQIPNVMIHNVNPPAQVANAGILGLS